MKHKALGTKWLAIPLIPWAAALIYGVYCAVTGFDRFEWLIPGKLHGFGAFLGGILYMEIRFLPVFIASIACLVIWLVKYTKQKNDQLM